MPEAVCTFTLTRYPLRQAWWAMSGVGRDRPALEATPGLRFVRLLGTGRGANLGLGADLCRWAMFAVWESATAWEAFEGSALRQEQHDRAQESFTALLRPLRWHGQWGGHDPFQGMEKTQPTGLPVAALTRATLRPARLLPFWRAVPRSMDGLHDNPGLIASVGVGEVPLLHQATFSLWHSAEALTAFAYAGAGHREAMRRARTGQWFGEELFARFEVLGTRGLWDGR